MSKKELGKVLIGVSIGFSIALINKSYNLLISILPTIILIIGFELKDKGETTPKNKKARKEK